MILVLTTAALLLGSCATTKQARGTKPSGFLEDYSMLKKGTKDEALMVYVSPAFVENCRDYDKVMIEPVTIWTDGDIKDVPEEDRQHLVNYVHEALKKELYRHYSIVHEPQPGTLKIRVALTEAEGSWVVLDTISSIVPQMLVISQLKNLATGTASFVGKAGVEADVTDVITGERLLAGVDRRAGQKSWSGMTKKWDDVEKSYDLWAKKIAARLAGCGAIPEIKD
ncbi:MAG: DUF3313 domain-containing protein [Pseudomonadota bacterium]